MRDELLEHLADTAAAVDSLAGHAATLARWGREWAATLGAGGHLLAAGNGGSAAEAQHLTAELVGRYRGERTPLSAWPLHGDGSAVTAIANDYGADEVFARQVRAHGRPGDLLVLLSTSGRSPNLLTAACAGRECGMRVFGLTGPGPNPLTDRCHDALHVESPRSAAVQEAHLVAVHLLCTALDAAVAAALTGGPEDTVTVLDDGVLGDGVLGDGVLGDGVLDDRVLGGRR